MNRGQASRDDYWAEKAGGGLVENFNAPGTLEAKEAEERVNVASRKNLVQPFVFWSGRVLLAHVEFCLYVEIWPRVMMQVLFLYRGPRFEGRLSRENWLSV